MTVSNNEPVVAYTETVGKCRRSDGNYDSSLYTLQVGQFTTDECNTLCTLDDTCIAT